MWSRLAIGSKQPSNINPIARQQPQTQGTWGRNGYYSQPSKQGDRACKGFNRGACPDNTSHSIELHVCEYCLKTIQRLCRHAEMFYQSKGTVAKNGVGWGSLSRNTRLIVDGMEDDNVDIDLGYTNDHEINSSCHQPRLKALQLSPHPMDSQRPHSAFQLPAPPLGAIRVASASPLTCALAHASSSMPVDFNPKSTTLTSTSRPQGTVSACIMQCTPSVASKGSVITSPQKNKPCHKGSWG